MQERNAQIALLISSFLWGISPIVVEIILEVSTPLDIMTLRFGIAVLVSSLLLPIIKARNGLSLLKNRKIMVIGFLIAMGYLTSTMGQDLTTAGLATLLSTSYIIIVPFLSWRIESTSLSKGILTVATMASVGIFLISFNGEITNLSNTNGIGVVLLLIAASVWGLNIVLSSQLIAEIKFKNGQHDPLSFLYATLVYTFIPLFILSILTKPPSLSSLGYTLPFLIFLGIFSTIVTFGLHNWALSRLGSVKTTFYLLLQIIVPFGFELLFGVFTYSPWIIAGIFLVLFSMVLLEFKSNASFSFASTSKFRAFKTKVLYKFFHLASKPFIFFLESHPLNLIMGQNLGIINLENRNLTIMV
ncbi:MAG: DMT family transporter [Candidatus Hodarchaeales archaeon]|jgi:drug/metabolite transporter (DMT)-like permease